MLAPYLFAVCRASAHDQDSGSFSLFHLLHQIVLPTFAPRIAVQLETHIYFEASADLIGREVEFRILWCPDAGEAFAGDPHRMPVAAKFNRYRFMFLRMPPTTGAYRMRVEWRTEKDGEWEGSSLAWPLAILVAPAADATPADPAADATASRIDG